MLQSSRIVARRCLSGVHCRSGLSTVAAVAATPAPFITSNVITDDVAELIDKYTKKKQTSASLDTLLRTGRGELLGKGDDVSILSEHMPTDDRIRMQVASFLRKDLPIRLAHRILDLDQVPMMSDMESVKEVKNIYIESFQALVQFPKIRTPEDEHTFATLLEGLYQKHSSVLMQMARGAYELREAVRTGEVHGSMCTQNRQLVDFEDMEGCHEFLDDFYSSRIGIRVLAGQYLALRDASPPPNYVGMICTQTSPYEIVSIAGQDATMMCERKYGAAPQVEIRGYLHQTFPYFPTHLHYVLLELLKNAMRATMEKHEGNATGVIPPIQVVIADGTENEDVVIKVSDEGGGISRSQLDSIWSYLYTTADPSIQDNILADHSSDSPLAGLGYGLPISRSYVRYFGGDLHLLSMEGHGTDAFVYLKRLGNSSEPLPIY